MDPEGADDLGPTVDKREKKTVATRSITGKFPHVHAEKGGHVQAETMGRVAYRGCELDIPPQN